MYALKTPSFLKPTSRPTSPAPAPPSRTDPPVPSRPTSKLSFSNFKRTASPIIHPTPPLVHDGSYMEVLSLKLGEAISKALAQPLGLGNPAETVGGRRPIPPGRGRALGELIATEIKSTRENPHLYRAVLRTLHRPLSVLVTNLSAQLIPLIASPAFLTPAVPTLQSPHPNATQLHALGLAAFAGELLDTFDALGLGQDSDMRGDGLKLVRDSLMSTIKRVVEPLVNAIRNDLSPHVDRLEQPASAPVKTTVGTKVPAVPAHPSIVYLTSAVPLYAKALDRYITSAAAEPYLASLTISLLWRGLVALSHRPLPPPAPPLSSASSPATTGSSAAVHTTPPGSPPLQSKTLALKEIKRRSSSGTTPPTTPPASRFTLKLPPSRPASPQSGNDGNGGSGGNVAGDARALGEVLAGLPRPREGADAREAVEDGFSSLKALAGLFEWVGARGWGGGANGGGKVEEVVRELTRLTEDIPVLIALPVLLRVFVFPPPSPSPPPPNVYLSPNGHLTPTTNGNNATTTNGQTQTQPVPERTVASILGMSDSAYRNGCLSGFGRAEECVPAVGQRMLDILLHMPSTSSSSSSSGSSDGQGSAFGREVVVQWLRNEVAEALADQQLHLAQQPHGLH